MDKAWILDGLADTPCARFCVTQARLRRFLDYLAPQADRLCGTAGVVGTGAEARAARRHEGYFWEEEGEETRAHTSVEVMVRW